MKNKRILGILMTAVLLMGIFGNMTALAGAIYTVGDSGEEILSIQNRLVQLGYTDAETDGVFGEGTEKAILMFQRCNDLLETGFADEVTVRLLMSDAALPASSWNSMYVEYCDMEMPSEAAPVYGIAPMPAATGAPIAGAYSKNASVYVPEWNTQEYTFFTENGFRSVSVSPLSTFAADIDTASWTQIRQRLLRGEQVPADSVRIEEMLNYFHYDYNAPANGEPFGVTMELGDCPWNKDTKLLLIGLQAETVETEPVPKNLVFLIDVSGSMDSDKKLPLVKRSFLLLLDTLGPDDTVSIVTYASSDRVVLDGVPASEKTVIMQAINNLKAGGGTNGAAGIQTAYALAKKHFAEGGINRILLATDGDLNIGISSEGDLARMVMEEKKGGVSLTCLGFGGYNYKDNRMEALADYGDGNYYYIDDLHEARRALITEAGGTFRTVAKDVKLQVDFNPAYIKGYRLVGYEDRLMAAEDFADDSKDGGELGSGHRVTVLYELVPAGSAFDFGAAESRYAAVGQSDSPEWLTLSVRAKAPDSDTSTLYTYSLDDPDAAAPTENLTFAAGVAEAGMLMRNSPYAGDSTWDSALALLRSCPSVKGDVYKEELVYLLGLMSR